MELSREKSLLMKGLNKRLIDKLKHMNKIKALIVVLAVSLLLGAFFILKNDSNLEPQESSLIDKVKDIENYSQDSKIEEVGSKIVYKNVKYNFSVEIPDGFNVANFQEGDLGDIVLVKNENKSIQFFIMSFDEPGLITPQRIKQDLPDLKIEDSVQVIIGQDKIQALLFSSQDESLNATKEIWFVKDGYLYQISTNKKDEKLMGQLLETLKF